MKIIIRLNNRLNNYFCASLIIIVISFISFFPNLSYSKEINKINEELVFDFHILESEYKEGQTNEKKYINGDLKELGFVKYDGKTLPKNPNYKRSMYTFRDSFYVDESLKDRNLGLYIGFTDYSYNIYINNILIHKSGIHKNGSTSRIYYAPNIHLPSDKLNYNDKINEIAVEIFPKYEIVALSKVTLSSYDNVTIWSFWRNLVGVHLIKAGSILALLIGIYFILSFVIRKPNDMRFFYFALFCFSFVFGFFDITCYHDTMDEVLFLKIARNGLNFSSIFLFIFMTEFTKILHKIKWIKIGLITLGIIVSIILIIQPTKQALESTFTYMMNFFMFPLLVSNLILLLIAYIRKRDRAYIVIFIAFLILVGSGLHDSLFFSNNIMPYAWFTSYGYMVLILGIFYVLAMEYSYAYNQSRIKSEELRIKNIELESAKKQLQDYSEHLEDIVEERTQDLNRTNKTLTQKNKQLLHELKMAERVQRSIIPNYEKLPHRKELDFGSNYSSMESIGGDLYDVIRIGRNAYGFLIADVSGHGVSAALITTMAKVSFNSHVDWGIVPGKACDEVNKELFSFIGDLEYYITAYYGILNLETGMFQYTNAGHHPAILYHSNTKEIEKLDSKGFIIGVIEEAKYETRSIELNEGDRILLFTDGIIEARNEKGEFYEYERFIRFIKKNSNQPVKEFVNNLMNDINEFCEGYPANDDRALLCIEYISKISPDKPITESIQVEARFSKESTETDELDVLYKDAIKYVRNDEYEKALNILTDLDKFYPDDSKILNALGIAYYKSGKLEQAQETLKKALRIDKKNQKIKKNLSIISKKLDDYYNKNGN